MVSLLLRFGQLDMASDAFQKALKKDSKYLSALVNLGNIYFYQKKYSQALEYYVKVAQLLDRSNRSGSSTAMKVFLNISRTYYGLEKFEDAVNYYKQAAAIKRK